MREDPDARAPTANGLKPAEHKLVNPPPDEVYALPASLGQERFWALDRLIPGNPAWNLPVRFRLEGPLDSALIERAFNEIVRRHEVLRTTFMIVDGHPAQVIATTLKIATPLTDLRQLPRNERDAEVERLSVAEAHRRFDLTTGPLLRVGLLRTGDQEHVLLVTPHHSIADYWSIGLISNEIGALYEAYAAGRPSPLPELPIQYADYAVWQREQSQSALVQKELGYWKKQLETLPALEFPTDHPRPAAPSYNATITSALLPVALTDSIKAIANRESATFFNTMLAAAAIVIHRYTGQLDFGIATQVAGRTSVELEALIGLFINSVVLRMNLSGDPTFRELLGRVSETGAQSIVNQNLRFEQLLKELRPDDYPSTHTLFRLNFICQRDPVKPLEFAQIKLTVIPSKSQGALYDLNIFLVLRTEGWRLACEYNTDLFEADTIVRLLGNYRAVLEAIAQEPDRRISELANFDVPRSREELALGAGTSKPENAPNLNGHVGKSSPGPGNPAESAPPSIARLPEAETYAFPITPNQQRFRLLDQLMPGSPALNMQAALRLNGPLDVETLGRCLNELIGRHETLRTTFTTLEGQPVQVIHPFLEVSLELTDLQKLPDPERESKAQQLLHAEALRVFMLAELPLFRAGLLRLTSDHHILILTVPHIICDGWSNGILLRELTALYEAYSHGRPSPLPAPSIQYADFAHWQNEWLRGKAFEEELSYWKEQLKGKLPLLDLPIDRPARTALVSRGETETLSIPPEFVRVLKDFCKREELTMFMLFLAVFNAMLHRYTGQEDILVGSPVAGRTPETEDVVGPFSYPISLRSDLSGNPTFRELARRVRDVTVGALAHKDLPFGRLVDALKPEQVQGRNPLFQVYFLHQVAFLQSVRTGDLAWTPLTWVSAGTAFDLHLATLERGEGVIARLEYNPEMFDAATVQRMLGHFRVILEAVLANPEVAVAELPMLTPAELQITAPLRSSLSPEGSTGGSILEAFEAQVRRTPKAIAISAPEGTLTYEQLEARANSIADQLNKLDLGPEKLVGIGCDFSASMIAGRLGTLKAGGAYVRLPQDPATSDSIPQSLAAGIKVVLSDRRTERRFAGKGVQVVRLDRRQGRGAGAHSAQPLAPDSVACVLLTSGFSADTRAAVITHAALRSQAASCAEACGLNPGDRVAVSGSDTGEVIFASLISGAAVAFAPPGILDSSAALARFIAKQKCSVLALRTRSWQRMVLRNDARDSAWSKDVRLVVIHGAPPSAIAMATFRAAASESARLVIGYGTAETGLCASVCEPRPGDGSRDADSRIALGTGAGHGLRLLDRHLQPVPVGVCAEICVEGECLARGYHNETETTAARFATLAGNRARVFRTGDLGRYLPDGRIEFLGSPARHINLRGFRLTLGELEAALIPHPAVREVAAVTAPGPSGEQQPIVYVEIDAVVAGAPSPQRDVSLRRQLRALVAESCPGYPRTVGIVLVNKLDLDADGHANPDALPAVEDSAFELGSVLKAPRDGLESQLIKVWQEVLGIRPIGITDSFFDLNGHSLLALRLFAKINALWKKDLPLSTLFQAPTIEQLAEILRQHDWSPPSSCIVTIRPEGTRPPLYIISGLGGNVVRFRDLARYLPPDVPVYALQPPGLDGTRPYLTRLEDMAAHYIREIKTRQPAGPYCLAGYSFGGLVAFEMARQLEAQHDRVGLLALLDAPEWHYIAQTLKAMGRRERFRLYQERLYKVLFGPDRTEYVRDAIRRRTYRIVYTIYKALGRPLPQNPGAIADINSFAAAHYVPQVYSGKLTLFRTAQEPHLAMCDYHLGWGGLATGGIDVHEILGHHLEITSEPNVRMLAEKLGRCLPNAEPGLRERPEEDPEPAVDGLKDSLNPGLAGQTVNAPPALSRAG